MNPSRQITTRLLAMAALATVFVLAWHRVNSVPLLVLGQPSVAGRLQREQEQPFFANLANKAGLPLQVLYQTADAYGLKDSHQLLALRDGRLDLISLRFMQNSQQEPALEGIDLPGMNQDFQTARRAAAAYAPLLDRYLSTTYGAKLLGLWSFGPQVLFCQAPITSLADLRGRKVRVASASLARVITSLGGTPVILPFPDTKEALRLGVVTCAVTSAASAEFAAWDAHSSTYYPLVFQFGFNGYVMSLKKWNSLSPDQQRRLSLAFRRYTDTLWRYSEQRQLEAERCMTGGPCDARQPGRLVRMPVDAADLQRLQQQSRRVAVPHWLRLCEQRHPGCSQDWQRTIAPLTAMAQPATSP